MKNKVTVRLAFFLLIFVPFLFSCEAYEPLDARSEAEKDGNVFEDTSDRETIWGTGGIGNIFNPSGGSKEGNSLGVNSFLWRASLDTVVFMPVSSADPFGGVIITDWHTPEETPSERFKLNIYILGKVLRADGIRVSAFRQVDYGDGVWKDAAMPKETRRKIEDAILTRARQLRNSTMSQDK